jgi:penicillin amidase
MNLARSLFRLFLGRRLPLTRGRVHVAGVHADVEIRRDVWGIPHIRAESDDDAWLALGFCHGQDRAFQLESILRLARGTLSEIVGADALPVDRLSRRIGFHHAARRGLEVQHSDVRAAIGAYTRGVNAGREIGLRRRPHELVFLRCQPSTYSEVDAASVLPLMSFLLASNWDAEIARWRILLSDGPEAMQAIDPSPYPSDFSVTKPPGAEARPVIDRLSQDLETLARYFPPGGASNSWVVDGSRTRSGRPIVANDPHLSPALPSPWYLAHIETPNWSCAGASFVGGPGISVGHNAHGAWGVTSGFVDNTDLFLEQVGEDGRSVRGPDGFHPAPLREETISIKGQGTICEEVLETPRGPIISPALRGEEHAISLRAVWLDPLPLRGTICAHKARDFDEFRECFREWPTLPLNFVWGETSGRIGWQLAGAAPKRRSGWGTIPLPGWLPESGWEDEHVPFEQMPFLDSPPGGIIATANTAPLSPDEEPFLGADFLDSYRQERIVEELEKRSDWDVDGTMRLQLDVHCLPWREMREQVLAACDGRSELQGPAGMLRDWNGELSMDSPAASLYEFLVAALCLRIASAEAPGSVDFALGRGVHPILPHTHFATRRVGHLVRALREEPSSRIEATWEEVIGEALAHACHELISRFGKDPARWVWGEIRGVYFRHSFGEVKTLAPIFNRGPFAMGGDANTVAQSAVDPMSPMSPALFIPSLRMVADVGNWDACRFVLPGGQSGNPLSRHYDDQLGLWLDGEAVTIPWSRAAVEEATVDTLVLSKSPSSDSDTAMR